MAYCPKCGKQIPETAKFCAGCGASIPQSAASQTASEASQAVSAAEAVQPAVNEIPAAAAPQNFTDPAPAPKKRTGLIIAIIAAVVVVLGACAVFASSIFANPVKILNSAAAKSCREYAAAAEAFKTGAVKTALDEGSFSAEVQMELDEFPGLERYTGMGLRINSDVSRNDQKFALRLTPCFGSTGLLTVNLFGEGSMIYLGCPELLDDEYFSEDTAFLGEDLAALTGYGDLGDLSFNLFEVAASFRELAKDNDAAIQAAKDATASFEEKIEVEKLGSEDVTVNGKSVKAKKYSVSFDCADFADYIEALADAQAASDKQDKIEQILKDCGLNDDAIDMIFSEYGDEWVDELVDLIKDAELNELNVYISDGLVVAADVNVSVDSADLECNARLELGGGDAYVNDLSLQMVIEDDYDGSIELYVASSGNHACADKNYSDETTISIEMDGDELATVAFETAYSLESGEFDVQIALSDDSLDEDYKFSVSGQITEYGDPAIEMSNDIPLAKIEDNADHIFLVLYSNLMDLYEKLPDELSDIAESLLWYLFY